MTADEVDTSNSFPFPVQFRLKSSEDFQRVFETKQRAGNHALLVFGAINHCDYSRIGLSVSRKHGNAVVRNRKKRLLREAFRLSQHEIPAGFDFVIIPRVDSPGDLAQYRKSLIRLTSKIVKRISAAD